MLEADGIEHDRTVGESDDVVVVNSPPVGVEDGTRYERHRMEAALRVGDLNAVSDA
jgi:hypothetical protein